MDVSNTGLVTALREGNVTIEANLFNASGEVLVTIFETPPIAFPIVSMSNVVVLEGSGGIEAISFTVQLTTEGGEPLGVAVAVAYASKQGSATPENDYCFDRGCTSSEEIAGRIDSRLLPG